MPAKTSDDLEHRIADAFATPMSSSDLDALLREVNDAAAVAAATKEKADDVAMNPATRPERVKTAREESADATFRAARYEKAVEGLTSLLEEAKSREAAEARQRETSAALKERDELAADLEEYWKATDKIVDLLTRLSRNNRRLGGDHRRAGPHQGAEAIARGVQFIPHEKPSIVDMTRLVGRDGRIVWPPTASNGYAEFP